MPSSKKFLIVHFGELWLRGNNRNQYIRVLKNNITSQLRGESFTLGGMHDRLIITPGNKGDIDSIKKKISKVFGISAYEVAYSTKPDMKHIVKMSMDLLKESGVKKVKVNSHRSYKGFRFNSIDIIKRVCKEADKIGIEPTLEGFEKQLYIRVTRDEAFIFMDRSRGAGGLPVGTSGKCIVLMSGGIDSPVAAWYAMKRGLIPIYLHIHGFSSDKEAKSSKIPRMIKTLSEYYASTMTYYVPSHIFQMSAMKTGRYELVMIKAFMMMAAERIAKKEGAGAIITGESLGQVASQTVQNIAAEQSMLKIPVLRPLIGLDKEEITRLAEHVGTYEDSIKPYKDVCSINARSPVTNSSIQTFKKIAKEMGLAKVVERSLKKASVEGTIG